MIEVHILETASHQWLVVVDDNSGVSRIVASCPYPQYAEVVADGLEAVLTDDNVDRLDSREPV